MLKNLIYSSRYSRTLLFCGQNHYAFICLAGKNAHVNGQKSSPKSLDKNAVYSRKQQLKGGGNFRKPRKVSKATIFSIMRSFPDRSN
jgi:hypothetical protein